MLALLLTVTVVIIHSAAGDCSTGINQCTTKYFTDVSENAMDQDLLCQSTRVYIICIDNLSCFQSQSEKELFYIDINARLRTNFQFCKFTAEQVIDEYKRNETTTKIPVIIGSQTTTAMPECLAGIQRCASVYFKSIAIFPTNTNWVCSQSKILAGCIIGVTSCEFTVSDKRDVIIRILQELSKNSLSCSFTVEQLLAEFVAQ